MKNINFLPWRKQKEYKKFYSFWLKLSGLIFVITITAAFIYQVRQNLLHTQSQRIAILQKYIRQIKTQKLNYKNLKKQQKIISNKLNFLTNSNKNQAKILAFIALFKTANTDKLNIKKFSVTYKHIIIDATTAEKDYIDQLINSLNNVSWLHRPKILFNSFKNGLIDFSIYAAWD